MIEAVQLPALPPRSKFQENESRIWRRFVIDQPNAVFVPGTETLSVIRWIKLSPWHNNVRILASASTKLA